VSQILRTAIRVAVASTIAVVGLSPIPASAVTFGNPVEDPIQNAPYVVSIWKSDKGDVRQAEFICSGTLISSNIVLTAAHCTTFPNSSFFVKIGAVALREDKALYPATPWTGTRYDPKDINGDIGLLRVNTKISGMTFPSLANTKVAKQITAKTRLTLMGWGLNQNKQTADTLQYSALSLQDQKSKTAWGKLFNVKTMISAGNYIKSEKKWSGSCNGDSGGPLFAKLNGINYVVGITSWGATDCRVEKPSIFSRVSYYEKDIRSGIKAVELLATSVNRLAPVEVIAPTLQGEGTPGTTLTCNPGTWENVVSVETSWLSPTRLQGTSNPVTKVIAADAGLEFKCRVTARSKSGDSEATVIRNVSKTLVKKLAVASKPTIGGLEGSQFATAGKVVRCEGWNWAEPVDQEVIQWFTVGTDNPTTPVNGKFIGSGKELTLTQEILKSERGRYLVCQLTGTRDNFPSYLVATKLLATPNAPVVTDVQVKSSSLKSGSSATCSYSGSSTVEQVTYQWGYTGAGNTFTPLGGQNADYIQINSQVLRQASGQKLACKVSLTSQGETTSRVGTAYEIFESALEAPKVSVYLPGSIYSGSSASCSIPYSSKYISTSYEWGITTSPGSDAFLRGSLGKSSSFTFDPDSILKVAGSYLTCVVTVENEIGKAQGFSSSMVSLSSVPALPTLSAPTLLRQTKENSSVTAAITIPSVYGFNQNTMEVRLKLPGSTCDGNQVFSFPSTLVCSGLPGNREFSASLEIKYLGNSQIPGKVSTSLNFRSIDATPAPSINLNNSIQSVTSNTPIADVSVVNSGGSVSPNGYSISPSLPSGLFFNSNTGTISGTPNLAQVQKSYTVTATGAGGTSTATFFLTVVAAETSPNIVLSNSVQSIFVNSAIQTVAVTNVGGTISPNGFSISPALPNGLTFNSSTGSISGTPNQVRDLTTYRITATGPAGSSMATFSLTVQSIPAAPSISISNATQSVTANTAIIPIAVTNSGGAINSSGFLISPSLPSGLSLNSGTGSISGTPTQVQSQRTYTLTAVGPGGSSTASFTLTVTAPVVDYNVPVVVSGSGVLSTLQITAGSAISATYRSTDDVGVTSSTLGIANISNVLIAQSTSTLASGTEKDGSYQATVLIPLGTPVGTYRVVAKATDASGKSTIGNSGISQFVTVGTFSVALPRDDQAPAIDGSQLQITPTLTNENGSISVSIPVSDNVGVVAVRAAIYRSPDFPTTPASSTTAIFNLKRLSGTALSGVWSGAQSMYYGGYLGEGSYSLELISEDAAGNSTRLERTNVFVLGMQGSGPYITDVNALPAVSPLIPGGTFKIQARINAYGKNVSSATCRSDGYNLNFNSPMQRISGSSTDGIYECTIALSSSQIAGTFKYFIEAGTDNGRSAPRVESSLIVSPPPPPPGVVSYSGTLSSPSITGQVVSVPSIGNISDGMATGSAFTVTFQVTGNSSIASAILCVDSSSGDNITGIILNITGIGSYGINDGRCLPAQLVSGNESTGTYSAAGVFPSMPSLAALSLGACGRYTARAQTTDINGNRSPMTTVRKIDIVTCRT
jgi:V8-like Glu-specific endopeptidase